MDYSFNIEIARQYGVNEAIFIQNLYFWIVKNEANGRHYYDGKHWTYNSAKALADLFPFWTENKINKLTAKMQADGLIHIGNYNRSKFDRTKWYALSDEVLDTYRQNRNSQNDKSNQPNGEMEEAKKPDGNSQSAEPIPDSKPDVTPYEKPDIGGKPPKKQNSLIPPTLEEIQAYCIKRKNNVDPKRFFDYFTSDEDTAKHWIDSKGNPVINWKQKIITWEGNHNGAAQSPKQSANPTYTKSDFLDGG